MDLLRLFPYELQLQGCTLKGTVAYREEVKCLAARQAEAIVPSLNSPPQSRQARAISETPLTWLTQFDLPWRSPDTLSHPTFGPIQAAFPNEWLVLTHVSHLPKSSQTSSSWPQWAPGLALAGASLDSQLGFTWETPSSAQVAATSDCFTAQVGWPWAKHRWGLTLACTTQETPEPVYPVDSYRPLWSSTALPLHSWSSMEGRGWRLVVSGHRQSLQLIGLGKPLPLICQQQPRLNYKGRVYSAHTKGAPRVHSLGDRGGCATGPYRTPTTLGHTTKTSKTWSHSSSA